MQSTSVDVVIVGAGLSGLQTARLVQEAGLSCIVLEAIDRVGGKTRTVRSADTNSGFNDLGAAWINDTSQSNMFALLKELKLTAVMQRAEGKDVMLLKDGQVELVAHGDLPPASEEDAALLANVFAKVQELVEEDLESPSAAEKARKLDRATVAEFCKEISGPNVYVETQAQILSQALWGASADDVSALFFVKYCKAGTGLSQLLSDEKDGAQYIRIREGTQSFAKGIAGKLTPNSVRLSTPVKSIHQHKGDDCEVKTTTGLAFRCKKVVVSISTCLYPMIEFNPPLPPAKKDLSENTTMCYYTKYVLVFSSPWWRDAGLSGSFVSDRGGPITFAFDTCVEQDEQWSISCFVVGKPGLEWSTLPMAARRKEVLEEFKYAFGKAVGKVPDPINTIEMQWSKDQYFQGAPCAIMGPGILTSVGKVLTKPFDNVHFVGTETADLWRGYMEGAVRSGIRGAKEVIEALKSQKKPPVAKL
ncbi:putative amine oxidase [Phyllosticta citribraziliensis]|uniref:Amine oxidase n=1 Tax=Phyllosticta citribraziliensis TaxID=989973 RepID=A0ABR1LD82_9PEZI